MPYFLEKEDDDFLLLETGDKIILDTLYFISGIATLNGSPVQNAKITLLNSDTDAVVADTMTDASGFYVFSGLSSTVQYHVVAEFDDSPDLYNAKSLPFMSAGR